MPVWEAVKVRLLTAAAFETCGLLIYWKWMETRLKGDFCSHICNLWLPKAKWGVDGEVWLKQQRRENQNTKIITTVVSEHLIAEKLSVTAGWLPLVNTSDLACCFLVHIKVAYIWLIYDCGDASLISTLCISSIRWRLSDGGWCYRRLPPHRAPSKTETPLDFTCSEFQLSHHLKQIRFE